MKKQIEEDDKISLTIMKEDRKKEKNKKENNSINSIRYLEQPMVNERNTENLKGPLYPPSLSGNRPKTHTNTTSTKRCSKKTYDKKILVKKTNGQKQFLDQRQNEDSPDYDHDENKTIT